MINQRTTTISAMALRKEPGRFLDQVYYQGQRFIVERAGEVKAVMVPLRDFEQMEQSRQAARDRLIQLTQQVRQQIAQAGLSQDALQEEIDTALKEVRTEQRTNQPQISHAGGD